MKEMEMPSREGIIETERLVISTWQENDIFCAYLLWGNPQISSMLTENGYTHKEIQNMYEEEKRNYLKYKVQYFPIFTKDKNYFIGVCGLHPFKDQYQFAIQILPDYWHRGYGQEVGEVIIDYAFDYMNASYLVAGRNPNDEFSGYVYEKLGFERERNYYCGATNSVHYSYILKK
jgi:RimJ/RimL family protein N-acetyltransferase